MRDTSERIARQDEDPPGHENFDSLLRGAGLIARLEALAACKPSHWTSFRSVGCREQLSAHTISSAGPARPASHESCRAHGHWEVCDEKTGGMPKDGCDSGVGCICVVTRCRQLNEGSRHPLLFSVAAYWKEGKEERISSPRQLTMPDHDQVGASIPVPPLRRAAHWCRGWMLDVASNGPCSVSRTN